MAILCISYFLQIIRIILGMIYVFSLVGITPIMSFMNNILLNAGPSVMTNRRLHYAGERRIEDGLVWLAHRGLTVLNLLPMGINRCATCTTNNRTMDLTTLLLLSNNLLIFLSGLLDGEEMLEGPTYEV